jgi:hypothetical protein
MEKNMSNNCSAGSTLLWGVVPVFIIIAVTSWLSQPYFAKPSVVVLHNDGCQVVRQAGMQVKDAGLGMCSTWANFSAVSQTQALMEFAAPGEKKTYVTVPFAQVAGYVQTGDEKPPVKN